MITDKQLEIFKRLADAHCTILIGVFGNEDITEEMFEYWECLRGYPLEIVELMAAEVDKVND